jgi:hypothetical protein
VNIPDGGTTATPGGSDVPELTELLRRWWQMSRPVDAAEAGPVACGPGVRIREIARDDDQTPDYISVQSFARGRDRIGLEVDADSPTGADGLSTSMGWFTSPVTESWHRTVSLRGVS